MEEEVRSGIPAAGRVKHYEAMPQRENQRFYIGIDVGSTSSDIVVLDVANNRIRHDYQRTKGKPVETLREQLGKVLAQIPSSDIALAVATGSVGRFLAKLLDIPFVNEVPAQATGIYHLYPQLQQAYPWAHT